MNGKLHVRSNKMLANFHMTDHAGMHAHALISRRKIV